MILHNYPKCASAGINGQQLQKYYIKESKKSEIT